jgi:hypothetical protein
MKRKSFLCMGVLLASIFTIMFSGCALIDFFTGTTAIAWADDAQAYRSPNATNRKVRLPSGGTEYPIWGTDRYTDDSSIGTAAVHAGLITFAEGGTVTIMNTPGGAYWIGSTRNGVTSLDYGAWDGGFEFVK